MGKIFNLKGGKTMIMYGESFRVQDLGEMNYIITADLYPAGSDGTFWGFDSLRKVIRAGLLPDNYGYRVTERYPQNEAYEKGYITVEFKVKDLDYKVIRETIQKYQNELGEILKQIRFIKKVVDLTLSEKEMNQRR